MGKVAWKPGALLSPVPPVLVTLGTMEHANIITIAWTGIVNTIPPTTYISVRPERYSYPILKETGEFVINFTTRDLVRAADWCGARSGAKFDKFREMRLHQEPVPHLSCPAIAESPFNLECKVRQILPLGSHDLFLAEIVGANVGEEVLDPAGRLHLERAGLVAYAHGDYYELGKKLGSFGFSVRKKPPVRRKPSRPPQKG